MTPAAIEINRDELMASLSSTDDEVSCAEEILARLASKAYRKPLAPNDLGALMSLYEIGASDGGFESGIRTALEGILASPHFVFRFEEPPANARPGEMYRIRDVDLATRLSFFLWGAGPDDELMAVARDGQLSDLDVLEAEARRVLDPITIEMEIIENQAYHRLLLMYRGEVGVEELLEEDAHVAGAIAFPTTAYGVANWFLYNGDTERADALLREIVDSPSWAAFGYIAAEADLARSAVP